MLHETILGINLEGEPFLRVFRLQTRKRRSELRLGEQLSNDIDLDK